MIPEKSLRSPSCIFRAIRSVTSRNDAITPTKPPVLSVHPANAHFNPPGFAMPGEDIERIGKMVKGLGRALLKRAAAAAKRPAKCHVAVLSEDFFPAVSCYFFSSPVEKQDPPLFVMGYNSLSEVIEDIFQVLNVR